MNFQGSGKRIEAVDYPRVGETIGVGEDEIRAIVEVEAAGSGFDRQGRVKILFEPHVFWRCLPAALRPVAESAGLAWKNWRRGYPPDSYPRLLAAMKIHETAALKACSWGLGQILGENHKAAGYATPQAMVEDFCRDEDNHLEAMVRFIKANRLDDEIRAHNWAGFAHGYNGPQYAVHGYHTKIAAAFAKWRKIADTPYAKVTLPASPPPAGKPASVPAEIVVPTGTVAAGAVVAKKAADAGAGTGEIVAVAALVIALAILAFLVVRKLKGKK